MKTIYYDFNEFIQILNNINNHGGRSSDLNKLKNELNRFFKKQRCKEVIYTKNTDKVFFGMSVSPIMNDNAVVMILNSDEKYIINEYYLEIDSKLFDPDLGLTSRELLAVLLHEVGHMVNTTEPVDNARNALDLYLAKTKSTLDIAKSLNQKAILSFGLRDVMRKTISIFEKDQSEEISADEFVYKCGYGDELQSALHKIVKRRNSIVNERDNKLAIFMWSIALYKNIRLQRIPALRLIKKGKQITCSELQKRDLERLERNLKGIDLSVNESADGLKKLYMDRVNRIRSKGIKSLKEDYYELALRAKNIDLTDEALIILRRINSNMSIIQDYLEAENLDDRTRDEAFNILEQYEELRQKLIKKDLYKEKQLFNIVYPDIKQKY